MDMKDMKIAAKDRSAIEKRYETMQEEYPCGLCLYLDNETLEKLGITELPKVGTELTLQAKVEVSSTSENEYDEGVRRSLNLQITALGLE